MLSISLTYLILHCYCQPERNSRDGGHPLNHLKVNFIGQHDLAILKNNYRNHLQHFSVPMITTERLVDIFDNVSNNHLRYFVIDTYQNGHEFASIKGT